MHIKLPVHVRDAYRMGLRRVAFALSVKPPDQHRGIDEQAGLRPALLHTLRHRPDVSPQWRCEVVLAMSDGNTALSLLDVLPQTLTSTGSPVAAGEAEVHAALASSQSIRDWLIRAKRALIQRATEDIVRHVTVDDPLLRERDVGDD
jgi:hypothetical protein